MRLASSKEWRQSALSLLFRIGVLVLVALLPGAPTGRKTSNLDLISNIYHARRYSVSEPRRRPISFREVEVRAPWWDVAISSTADALLRWGYWAAG